MLQFQDTFAGHLLEAALAHVPEAELEERAEDLTELIRTHLAKAGGGPVSFEGYLQIVLTLLVYALAATMRSNRKNA